MQELKVLVLGYSGFLGSKIVETTPKDVQLFCGYRKIPFTNTNCEAVKADLVNLGEFKKTLEIVRPDIVIHAARMDPYDSDPVRIKPLIDEFVMLIQSMSCKLVYISSDAIFDGKKGDYLETDIPNPLTDYGKAKLAAEESIKEHLDQYLIIRTSYIYGKAKGEWDKRTAHLLKQISSGETVFRYDNMYRSPILVEELAEIVWRLVAKDVQGIVNVAGEKKNIFEFSKKQLTDLHIDHRHLRANTLEENSDISADTSLNTERLKAILN